MHFMLVMDVIDKKIICELENNCRTPFSQIARKLRLNRNVVAYRVAKLEEQGIITKYVLSLRLSSLGYRTYKIYFKINLDQKQESDFVAYILSDKKVIHALKTEGEFDYSLAIAVKNVVELDLFLMDLKNNFPHLIRDYEISTLVYTKVFKLEKLLLGKDQGSPKIEKYSGEDTLIPLDEKDLALLRALSFKANIPIVDLAKKTNISLDIVKYRLKNLSGSVISSYRIAYNLPKLGFYFYRVLLRIKQATEAEERKLITWCSLRSNVLYCTKQISYYDFEINVAIRDVEDYTQFMLDLRRNFPMVIDSYKTLMMNTLLKLDYIPF